MGGSAIADLLFLSHIQRGGEVVESLSLGLPPTEMRSQLGDGQQGTVPPCCMLPAYNWVKNIKFPSGNY